jgi:hypothetical protein
VDFPRSPFIHLGAFAFSISSFFCTLRFDFELGQFLLWLISSAAVALLCSRRSLWGVPLSCDPGSEPELWQGCWVCTFFFLQPV